MKKKNNKNNKNTQSELNYKLRINKLITQDEIINIIYSNLLKHFDDDKDLTKSEIKRIINESTSDNGNVINFSKIRLEYMELLSIKNVIDDINFLINGRYYVDLDIDVDNFIQELYNITDQYGLGYLNQKKELNENDIENIKENYYVSYLNGVPLKTNFSSYPIIDKRQYEKYHGKDSFQKAAEKIKRRLKQK